MSELKKLVGSSSDSKDATVEIIFCIQFTQVCICVCAFVWKRLNSENFSMLRHVTIHVQSNLSNKTLNLENPENFP